jgi:anti-anti-sigma factor
MLGGERENLRVSVTAESRELVVRVEGELDIATASQLGEALNQAASAASPSVILDLHDASFVGVVGLHRIAETNDRLGKRFVVRDPAYNVRR